MKFLIKVPAEITAHATIDGQNADGSDGPMIWRAYATIDGRKFDLYDRPLSHKTEAACIAAAKREMKRRMSEWNKKVGL